MAMQGLPLGGEVLVVIHQLIRRAIHRIHRHRAALLACREIEDTVAEVLQQERMCRGEVDGASDGLVAVAEAIGHGLRHQAPARR